MVDDVGLFGDESVGQWGGSCSYSLGLRLKLLGRLSDDWSDGRSDCRSDGDGCSWKRRRLLAVGGRGGSSRGSRGGSSRGSRGGGIIVLRHAGNADTGQGVRRSEGGGLAVAGSAAEGTAAAAAADAAGGCAAWCCAWSPAGCGCPTGAAAAGTAPGAAVTWTPSMTVGGIYQHYTS